ncbi:DNA primase [Dyella sp. C9]|uniref:DNA primase n=1 Tax=Dyella sp. C9 TaxID=2202154 RepID=UPI0013003960|nr:DNA primase [Dyella sp. C9]
MSVTLLLNRLANVRRSPTGWRANCPNDHTSATSTLAISESSDGRILLHCFACQDTQGILSRLGLALADLYPERMTLAASGSRDARDAFKRHAWNIALGVLGREAKIAALAARALADGVTLSNADVSRVATAAQRIDAAREVLA